MKPLLLALISLCFVTAAHAQWQTTTYALKGGWNSIYLHGDATHTSIETLLPATVEEVWRWNPNPTQVQFIASPLIPSAGTPEWITWRRSGVGNTLSELIGGAYLVKCQGEQSDTYALSIKQSAQVPNRSWVRNGANLFGFPSSKADGSFPKMSEYFATFPAAVAGHTKIYKYVGGALGPSNPVQIFSPSLEDLDRTQAYWFSAEVVGDFATPVDLSLSNNQGLDFGRTGSEVTVRLHNRSESPVSLTFTPVDSEAAPLSQTAVTGPVPLTRRIFNVEAQQFESVPVSGPFTELLPPLGSVTLVFGIDRAAMSGAAVDAYFASLLRVTDSDNLFESFLPATASMPSLAGLWVGEARINAVDSMISGAGSATTRAFSLRTLLHISDSGAATLLSKVFLGPLAVEPNDFGICVDESLLKQDALERAQRLVAAHLPLNRTISGSAPVAPPGAVAFTVITPFNDASNPFVHQYHPDHDNKDARFQPAGAGVESYDITRTCTFEFTTAAPEGSTVTSGWGATVIGGEYRETISGVHKNDIQVFGTFELRRASEIGVLSQ
jgi:hypothetical protein